jgi:hypothetical protein
MVNNPGDCFVLGKLKYIKSMKKPREIRMRVGHKLLHAGVILTSAGLTK